QGEPAAAVPGGKGTGAVPPKAAKGPAEGPAEKPNWEVLRLKSIRAAEFIVTAETLCGGKGAGSPRRVAARRTHTVRAPGAATPSTSRATGCCATCATPRRHRRRGATSRNERRGPALRPNRITKTRKDESTKKTP